MLLEDGAEIGEFHAKSIFLSRNIVKPGVGGAKSLPRWAKQKARREAAGFGGLLAIS
jgi:hypothetical protein